MNALQNAGVRPVHDSRSRTVERTEEIAADIASDIRRVLCYGRSDYSSETIDYDVSQSYENNVQFLRRAAGSVP